MRAISLDMRRAALIRQDLDRPHVLPTIKAEGLLPIMAQTASSTTLSMDLLHLVQVTADVWRARGFGQTADNLLRVTGLAEPAPEPSRLPPNVFNLSDYRPRALQAVSR